MERCRAAIEASIAGGDRAFASCAPAWRAAIRAAAQAYEAEVPDFGALLLPPCPSSERYLLHVLEQVFKERRPCNERGSSMSIADTVGDNVSSSSATLPASSSTLVDEEEQRDETEERDENGEFDDTADR